MQCEIGTEIAYLRNHPKKGVVKGRGFIKAYGLDPENRKIVLIQDSEERDEGGKPAVFHTFATCVGPSKDMEASFKKLIDSVKEIETLANAEIKSITDSANLRIGEEHNRVFGEPVKLPE